MSNKTLIITQITELINKREFAESLQLVNHLLDEFPHDIELLKSKTYLLKQLKHYSASVKTASDLLLLAPSDETRKILVDNAFHHAQSFFPLNGLSYKRIGNSYLNMIVTEESNFRVSWESPTPKQIWQCWLQGIDKAPHSVQYFMKSVAKYHPDFNIQQINEENFQDFITLPPIIIQKYQIGIIPMPHFTDLLRLYLLDKYGGTWIDSTVHCVGPTPETITSSELFFYQNKNRNVISNWWITAQPNHVTIYLLKRMLTEYWIENDTLGNYYIMHAFHDALTSHFELSKTAKTKMPFMDRELPHANQFMFLKNKLDEIEYLKNLNASTIHKHDHKNLTQKQLKLIKTMDGQ